MLGQKPGDGGHSAVAASGIRKRRRWRRAMEEREVEEETDSVVFMDV